ncbi:MAG: hypothetical protein GXP62_07160, partial [Oligoflexia bacterium]|nr:hypothetical protein [Oligoflexia bacterium]
MPVPFQVLTVSTNARVAASAAVTAIRTARCSADQPVELTLDELPQHLAVARQFHGVTVVCGSDAILEPTRDQLDAERVGVAELYRHRLNAMIGPIAALAELACGPCGQGVLVAVPGGPDHVKVAIEELILPLAPRLLQHPASPTQPPGDPAAAIQRAATSVDAAQIGSEPRPQPDQARAGGETSGGAGGSGWEAGLLALRGTLDRAAFPPMPDRFERLAPARNVL